MNTIIGLVMAMAIATSTGATCPETTRWSYYSYGSETVSIHEETDWPLGETVVKDYEMSYDEWINR